jgi:MFS family permease
MDHYAAPMSSPPCAGGGVATADRHEIAPSNIPALDWLNFFLSDVRGGLGPFLAIFLMESHHWNPGRIGLLMTIAGIAGVGFQTPAGALVDAFNWKRGLIILCSIVVAAGTIGTAFLSDFWPVTIFQVLNGGADACFGPAIAAISLGLAGRAAFTRRIGRNESFNHGGNVATAILAGVGGYLFTPVAMLWIVAILALASIAATLFIDPAAIDNDRARGSNVDDHVAQPSGLAVIFESRTLLIFTAAITMFHFANAAMLPLLGEELAASHQKTGTLFMASCIIVAQAAMVPMAIVVGHKADSWGRKPLFLAGFAVLPIRGLLYTLWSNPFYLVSIQLLDGVGAGLFSALFILVIADLTKGTGRFNLAQGAASACFGLGAALSNGIAGYIVDWLGYRAAFLFLAGCASAAFMVLWLAMPETATNHRQAQV